MSLFSYLKQNGKDAVYTIKEEPKEGGCCYEYGGGVPSLRNDQADGSYKYGTEELAVVHIYPKNVVAMMVVYM